MAAVGYFAGVVSKTEGHWTRQRRLAQWLTLSMVFGAGFARAQTTPIVPAETTEDGNRSDAQDTGEDTEDRTRTSGTMTSQDDHASEGTSGVTVRATHRTTAGTRGRSTTTVTRRELEERLPRSAPDALRYVPGVSVQQTAHGQGSPYVRGVTGQQVLLVFDGVRLNNGVYRQGPNQYFFTVDSQTVDRIEVLRGSASTYWGSDAIGGAVLAVPVEPQFDPALRSVSVHPRAMGRFASADRELGGRGELEAQLGRDVAVLAGGGYRDVGPLQAAGPIRNLSDGAVPPVPYFEADGRTQRGTGFREATFDGRLVARLGSSLRAVAAVYGYRQFDAPRTDQCPPPLAPERQCLVYEEQFRTLAYAALRGDAGPDLRDVDVIVSYQRQHERRRLDRPHSYAVNGFVDDVDTLGITVRASTRRFVLFGIRNRVWPTDSVGLRVRYGGEAYRDQVASAAWITFTDVGITRSYSRGQYLDGSRFFQTGVFAEAELDGFSWLWVRAGGRAAVVGARAPADPESGTRAVDSLFSALVGRLGVELRPVPPVQILLNLDQGFRAPNLDDLTSRQQAGPGFQFENPDLRPERSVTYELGTRIRLPWFQFDAWGYATRIDGAMTRALRAVSDCPPSTPQCNASWSRYQLINVQDPAWILGAEIAGRVRFPFGLEGMATMAYAWGEGPNPAERPNDPSRAWQPRVPLSRIPPLNGTLEARWQLPAGFSVGAAVRWAADQSRLAPSDLGDARIPAGGTPGYAVIDLRGGYRFRKNLRVNVVVENLLDTPYRVHGSSINGPGRGVIVSVGGGF